MFRLAKQKEEEGGKGSDYWPKDPDNFGTNFPKDAIETEAHREEGGGGLLQ